MEALHPRIISALENQNYETLSKLLDEAEDRYPEEFTAFNYAYFSGYVGLLKGEAEAAGKYFLKSVSSGEILADYAMWELSRLAAAQNDTGRSEEYLNRLLAEFPLSAHRREAYLLLAQNASGAGAFPEAVSYIEALLQEEGSKTSRPSRILLAEYYAAGGQTREAVDLLREIIHEKENDDFAWKALQKLEMMEETDTGLPPPGPQDLHRRGMACYHNRNFDRAIDYFKISLARVSEPEDALETEYMIGRSLFRLGRYEEAGRIFQRIVQYPDPGRWKIKSLYMTGRADQMRNDLAGAARAFTEVTRQKEDYTLSASAALRLVLFPGDIVPSAMKEQVLIRLLSGGGPLSERRKLALALAAMEAEKGDYKTSLNILERVSEPHGTGRVEIQFKMARYALLSGESDRAADLFGKIIAGSPGGFYRFAAEDALLSIIPEVDAFLDRSLSLARTALESGDSERARCILSGLPSFLIPASYRKKLFALLRDCYEHHDDYRAGLELRIYTLDDPFSEDFKKYAAEEALQRMLAFLQLHLFEPGAEELEKVLEKNREDFSFDLTGSKYLFKAGRPAAAIRKAGGIMAGLPPDFQLLLLPREMQESLYPFYYRDILEKRCLERALDTCFMLALIREESRFDAGARSGAAARGLMQFIPETAASVAASLGIQDFKEDDLYNPDMAINLGTSHMAGLLKKYEGNCYHALSAYNAGSKKTDYWKKNARGDDLQSFLSAVEYSETRRYIQKVLTSYYLYLAVYEVPGKMIICRTGNL